MHRYSFSSSSSFFCSSPLPSPTSPAAWLVSRTAIRSRCRPDSRVLNRELGAAGLAWWYRQYSKDESLGKLEAEARATRRGLWADRDPSRPGPAEAAEGAGVLKDRLTPAMQAGVADYVRRQTWQ